MFFRRLARAVQRHARRFEAALLGDDEFADRTDVDADRPRVQVAHEIREQQRLRGIRNRDVVRRCRRKHRIERTV